MGYLDLAKKAKEEYRKLHPERTVADATEGRIVAVEICSNVLEAHIWLAFDRSFEPKDGQAVFYADELSLLRDKTVEQLRKIHNAKLVFSAGSVVQQQ